MGWLCMKGFLDNLYRLRKISIRLIEYDGKFWSDSIHMIDYSS